MRLLCRATIVALVIAACASALAQTPSYRSWAEIEADLVATKMLHRPVPMRDGVQLDANIYLPHGEPPFPVVLYRSPYLMEMYFTPGLMPINDLNALLLRNGYAIVHQNERGRYWSGGEYEYLANAGEDGYDTIEWISKQPWSNGKVGTFGCSSTAENQLKLSTAAHPAHAAAIALGPGAGIGKIGPYSEQGNTYRGGALQLLFASWYRGLIFYGKYGDPRPQYPEGLSIQDRERLGETFRLHPNRGDYETSPGFDYEKYYRHLPVADLNKAVNGPVTDWDRFARRSPGDPAWKDIALTNEGDKFGVPMLWGFSWYDVGVAPNVALYNYARENTSTERARNAQQMFIGPTSHCMFGAEKRRTIVGERDLGDARYDYIGRFMQWYDYWLKGIDNGALERPKVEYYQMGSNQWVSGDRFPAEGTKLVDLYLTSAGHANTLYGDGVLSFERPKNAAVDTFVYDPLRPVQTHGGGACCMGSGVRATGSYDQSTLEMRKDILVYTSPVLEEDLVVAGFVEVELYVSSDARDTDFTLKLIDVDPDGVAYNLDDNIFRVRYREGYDRQVFMKPGEVYKLTFPPMITANTFKKGHRVRLEVSSSNFPRYDRNLNTGGNNFDESKAVVARNSVHHSAKHPSRIRLPVSPPDTLKARRQ
jgi:putative CocE/NonD family hydrolase